MKIAGFVQARMSSTRLWGKSMLPLGPGGYPVALHCYWRLKAAWPGLSPIWWIPTSDPADQELIDLAKSLGEPYIVQPTTGSNLAAAYVQLCDAAQADLYISIEADSPLADTELLARQMVLFQQGYKFVVAKPLPGKSINDRIYAWSAGGCSLTPAWFWRLQEKYARTQYLRETPGAFQALYPESLDEVPMPVGFFSWLQEDYDWYRPYHLSLENSLDGLVLNAVYDALWKGPGPENIIMLKDALAYLDTHPNVVRYNREVVDSIACAKARDASVKAEDTLTLYYAMWEAMNDAENRIQKCEKCGGYLGHVRDDGGRHWFYLPNGVKLRGRADIKCPKCHLSRRWFEDK